MGLDSRFVSDAYSLIPGPTVLTEPVDSQDVQEVAGYALAEILATLLALPGVRCLGGDGGRAGWTAAWESGNRVVFFEDVEEMGDEGDFGGLRLRCDCRVSDVQDLWERMRERHPGLWLIGPDGWLLTPPAFVGRLTFDSAWRTADAVALASGIQAEGAFDRMPILADALQDAGCDNDDILTHCRDTSLTHVRGCWVVDLVLGKE